ncbi:MAG: hypothetical protein HFI90_12505 [Clostridia bacterium]|nr:hypothetical protein [Clostridia bacterium]
MYQTFEGMFHDYLIDTEEIVTAAWEESLEKQEAETRRDAISKKLLALIPPKKRKRAKFLLEDFDATHIIDTGFYYQYGMKNNIRLLKLLGVL